MNRIIKIITLTIFATSLLSCSSNIYYVGELTQPTNLYSSIDTTSSVSYNIPNGTIVLTQKKAKNYHYVIVENHKGYVYNPKYKNYHKYNSKVDGLMYGYSTDKSTSKTLNINSKSNSGSGKSVNVKGYYRKNGTYVRPHTRSSPGSGRHK